MYDMIRRLNLGNLSGLPRIPEYYIRCLLGYIIQISRAMAHAHENGLVHGKFNLSKILVQQKTLKESEVITMQSIRNRRTSLKRSSTMDLDQRNLTFNFYISNFEPFQVLRLLHEYTSNKEEFKMVFKKHNDLKLDYKSVSQVVKIQDLQAFGNSIIEIMVGRSEQFKDYSHTDASVTTNEHDPESTLNSNEDRASRATNHNKTALSSFHYSLIGKIPLDLIPLNWGKMPETQAIFKIISLCYGPYDPTGNLGVDTVKQFR